MSTLLAAAGGVAASRDVLTCGDVVPRPVISNRIPCKARLFVTKPQRSCEAMVKIYRDVSG
jgi:hypothetical protein